MGAFAREQLVERDAAPQDAVEDVGGDSSSGEAGDFRLGRGAWARHTPIVADKLCRGRELRPKISSAAPSPGRPPGLGTSPKPAAALRRRLLQLSCSAGW